MAFTRVIQRLRRHRIAGAPTCTASPRCCCRLLFIFSLAEVLICVTRIMRALGGSGRPIMPPKSAATESAAGTTMMAQVTEAVYPAAGGKFSPRTPSAITEKVNDVRSWAGIDGEWAPVLLGRVRDCPAAIAKAIAARHARKADPGAVPLRATQLEQVPPPAVARVRHGAVADTHAALVAQRRDRLEITQQVRRRLLRGLRIEEVLDVSVRLAVQCRCQTLQLQRAAEDGRCDHGCGVGGGGAEEGNSSVKALRRPPG